MKSKKVLAVSLVALAAALSFFFSQSGLLVTEIIDGDTLRLSDGQTIRLIGLDTPEKGECYFSESSELVRDLLLDKKVRLETDTNKKDQYGRRTLGYLYLDDLFVNEYLLRQGMGEFYWDPVNEKYQAALIKAAEEAHEKKEGLWSACAPQPKTGCQIKGNLDRMDKRYYYLPGWRHYVQTEVNLDHGDRWFCTEKQAQEAGFLPARE